MKFNEAPISDFQLKVFTDPVTDHVDPSEFNRQLPFLDALSQQFEQVTGWHLDFIESKRSYNGRKLLGNDSLVSGELRITDLSEKLEAGGTPRHRGYCDRLVATLDSMIKLLQNDRARFEAVKKSVEAVVDLPFEWWGMDGKTGYNRGSFSSWSMSGEEKIRLFSGSVRSDNHLGDALSATTLISTFATACQTALPIHEIAPLLPAVLKQSRLLDSQIDWYSTVELDPITGEYQIDGFDSNRGLALIDVDASTAIRMQDSDNNGTLYSGQILCLGISDEQLERLNQKFAGVEMSLGHSRKIIESEFFDEPAIFVYRK